MNYHECGDLCWMKRETKGMKGKDPFHQFRVFFFRLRKDVRKERRSRNPPFLNTTFSLLKSIFYAFPLN